MNSTDLNGAHVVTEARVMARYSGAQIRTTRENIYIEFETAPSQIVTLEMRGGGFRKHPERDLWSATNSPVNVVHAQAVLNQHYGNLAKNAVKP